MTRGPSRDDLRVLALWWGSRAALALTVVGLAWVAALPGPTRITGPGGWLVERFVWWDAFHFLRIARYGYLPSWLPCCDQAFFPGYPFATAVVGRLVGHLVLGGLLVTEVSASVAVVLLARLGARTSGDARVGRIAVLLLAAFPYGIFLSSVYSEALFLALALGAWLAADRDRWWTAGLLAAAAAGVRVNGLFLVAALGVLHLTRLRAQGRRWPAAGVVAALSLPVLVVAGYVVYLHARTGSWDAWQQAQQIAWQRRIAPPWVGLGNGWRSLVTSPSNDLWLTRAGDLLFAVGGPAVTALLLARRRWPEAVWVGLNAAVLVCSTTLQSTPRYAVVWFPVFLLLARHAVRPNGRWVVPTALGLGVPGLVILSVTFSMHYWVA